MIPGQINYFQNVHGYSNRGLSISDFDVDCIATWKDGSDMYMYGKWSGSSVLNKDDSYRCFVGFNIVFMFCNKNEVMEYTIALCSKDSREFIMQIAPKNLHTYLRVIYWSNAFCHTCFELMSSDITFLDNQTVMIISDV